MPYYLLDFPYGFKAFWLPWAPQTLSPTQVPRDYFYFGKEL